MAKLSLDDKRQDFTGQPVPALDANLQPELPTQWQTIDAGGHANTRTEGISQSGMWDNGLLGPGSMSSSVPPSPSDGSLDRLMPTPGLLPDSFEFGLVELNATQESDYPLDMAWMNWEGFVGDVNLYDFDMPDLTEGFLR